jgi:hypothetical protein
MPVIYQAGLSTISPANTSPSLTLEQYANYTGRIASQQSM